MARKRLTENDWVKILDLAKRDYNIPDISKELALSKHIVKRAIKKGWLSDSATFPSGKLSIDEILKIERMAERGESVKMADEVESKITAVDPTARYEQMLDALDSTLDDVMKSKETGGASVILARRSSYAALQQMPIAGLLIGRIIHEIGTRMLGAKIKTFSPQELMSISKDLVRMQQATVETSMRVAEMEQHYLGKDEYILEVLRRAIKKVEMTPAESDFTLEVITMVAKLGAAPKEKELTDEDMQPPIDVEFEAIENKEDEDMEDSGNKYVFGVEEDSDDGNA